MHQARTAASATRNFANILGQNGRPQTSPTDAAENLRVFRRFSAAKPTGSRELDWYTLKVMSNLSFTEKHKLEKVLQMGSGYVLDFSNRTFQEFVFDSTGKNIFDDVYARASGSKANRLREFWQKEPNHIVGKLIHDLLEHSDTGTPDPLRDQCSRIAERLLQDAPVQDVEAILPNAPGNDFESLAKAVRECIAKNEPEAGLDRLHTFVVKYMRVLCEKYGIPVERDKPLHSLFGEYVKQLKNSGRIESEMTERILKSSISVLEAFNRVRNEQSLAHDNPILNYSESLLIFNHIASSIRFVAALEGAADQPEASSRSIEEEDEIPF